LKREAPPPAPGASQAPRLPSASDLSAEALERRRAQLALAGIATARLAGEGGELAPTALAGRIEGFVGWARVPVGVLGPLAIEGRAAQGEYFVPLATSEGALVMSFQHVANMLSRSSPIRARCDDAVVWRSPAFRFESMDEAARFVAALAPLRADMEALVASGSRYCRLSELQPSLVGRDVFVRLGYRTGDAAGQNMVTAATQAVCSLLLERSGVAPLHWQVESNQSGDKKASALALLRARGRRASAEVRVPDKLCQRYFRASAAQMNRAWRLSASGAVLSGTLGSQGNYANALAGLFIATGQDVACVAEAAIGLTCVELEDDGSLYCSVTLPNLIVGTVGGGTSLPTARECLQMLRCLGEGRADALAEVCAAVALVGEIAITGAMAGGSFARAHADASERSGRSS
jgi:hydroxymethylglutaryl-CoA reductase (NADPH)